MNADKDSDCKTSSEKFHSKVQFENLLKGSQM